MFKIAVQSWSFHKQLFRGELKAANLPGLVKGLGIDTLEWTAKTFRPGVVNVGGPFYLAGADAATRQKALDYCLQYVEPAQILGARILRAELYCDLPHRPGRERQAKKLAMEGLHALLGKS